MVMPMISFNWRQELKRKKDDIELMGLRLQKANDDKVTDDRGGWKTVKHSMGISNISNISNTTECSQFHQVDKISNISKTLSGYFPFDVWHPRILLEIN